DHDLVLESHATPWFCCPQATGRRKGGRRVERPGSGPVPPAQDAHGPEGDPARRLADLLHLKPGLATLGPVEGPGAVGITAGSDDLDGLVKTLVGRGAGYPARLPEVVEGTEDVVVGAIGVEESEIEVIGRFPRAEALVQAALQQELLPGAPRLGHLR